MEDGRKPAGAEHAEHAQLVVALHAQRGVGHPHVLARQGAEVLEVARGDGLVRLRVAHVPR